MAKNEHTVSYSTDDIAKKLARGEDRTDYAREVSQDEIAEQVTSDLDLVIPEDWEKLAFRGIPPLGKENKRLVSVRYSPRVIEYFKGTGKGWQTRMDAVLAAFVDRQERSSR